MDVGDPARPPRAVVASEVEVVAGSFDDLPEGVFDAVDAAFVLPVNGAGAFAHAAARPGVARVVLLSAPAAAREHRRDHGSASRRHHSLIEQDVRTACAGVTILRPGTFANNLLAWSFRHRQCADERDDLGGEFSAQGAPQAVDREVRP